MNYVVYFLICLCATGVGAVSGMGGGVIIKPVFDAFSGMPVSTISFLSGCTVLGMSTVSLLRSRSQPTSIEPRRGTLLAVGAAVGGIGGKQLFEMVKAMTGNDGLVGVVQSVMMIMITLGVLLYVKNKHRITTCQVQNGAVCVMIGTVLGVMSAFLGIGGGPINLAVLYFFFSMDTKTAALHSIYIILFSQIASFGSSVVAHNIPAFGLWTLVSMLAGGILGGFVGGTFSKKLTSQQVDKLFVGLLVVITGISVYNLFHYITML